MVINNFKRYSTFPETKPSLTSLSTIWFLQLYTVNDSILQSSIDTSCNVREKVTWTISSDMQFHEKQKISHNPAYSSLHHHKLFAKFENKPLKKENNLLTEAAMHGPWERFSRSSKQSKRMLVSRVIIAATRSRRVWFSLHIYRSYMNIVQANSIPGTVTA